VNKVKIYVYGHNLKYNTLIYLVADGVIYTSKHSDLDRYSMKITSTLAKLYKRDIYNKIDQEVQYANLSEQILCNSDNEYILNLYKKLSSVLYQELIK